MASGQKTRHEVQRTLTLDNDAVQNVDKFLENPET